MARTVHFATLLVSACCLPSQHLTWITDQDEMVANDDRLTDVMDFASRMMGLYVSFELGEFAMNDTSSDPGDKSFEDFVAIPDLVAGAFSEVLTMWSQDTSNHQRRILDLGSLRLTEKAETIVSWFSEGGLSLARCVILIDKVGPHLFQVRNLTPMQVTL
jgi:hypothetical protein